jgi:hypothetical protein
MARDPDQPRDGWPPIWVVLSAMLQCTSECLPDHIKHDIRTTNASRDKRRHRLPMAPIEHAEVLGRLARQ